MPARAYRFLSSAMRSNDDIDRPVQMLFFHDLRGLLCDDCHPLFIVVCFSAAYDDGRRGRTMTTCDAGRMILTDDSKRAHYAC